MTATPRRAQSSSGDGAGFVRRGSIFSCSGLPQGGDEALAWGAGLGSSSAGPAGVPTPVLICLGLEPARWPLPLPSSLSEGSPCQACMPCSHSWSVREAQGGARWAGLGWACLSHFKSQFPGCDFRCVCDFRVLVLNPSFPLGKMGLVESRVRDQNSSVAKSCPTLCDPMDCSTLGFPVLHYLPVCSNSCPLSQ